MRVIRLFIGEKIKMLRVKRVNPEGLTNEIIQDLGKHYLKEFGEKPNFFHSHQDIARSLMNYDKESTVDAKWYFLAEQYQKLTNHDGYIASNIIELFSCAFHKPIRTFYSTDMDLPMWEVRVRMEDIAKQYFLEKAVRSLFILSKT